MDSLLQIFSPSRKADESRKVDESPVSTIKHRNWSSGVTKIVYRLPDGPTHSVHRILSRISISARHNTIWKSTLEVNI